jgi:hypothetical protein
VSLSYENLEQVVINYYLMDAELLFSTNPFDSVNQNAFSLIRPNATETIALDKSQKEIKKELPPDFKNKNVLIEVRGGEQTKALPSYANGLNVQLIKSYGQIKVAAADDGRLLPKTYVKVYAQYQDGNIKFYKDGYTDLRGRFDYVTQSNSSTEGIQKFALFIQNDKLGTVIRYAIPPQE